MYLHDKDSTAVRVMEVYSCIRYTALAREEIDDNIIV